MSEVSEKIDGLRRALFEPVERPADADRAAEAAALLAEVLRWTERAQEFLQSGDSESAGAGDLAGLTLHEAARRVLGEAGAPLHASELGRRIKAGGWRHPRSRNARPDQIIFQLAARLPRQPDVFRRVSPNTFALAEWGDSTPPADAPKPRIGIFSGPGKPTGREVSDSDEPLSGGNAWRSS